MSDRATDPPADPRPAGSGPDPPAPIGSDVLSRAETAGLPTPAPSGLPASEPLPERIGSYRILRLIGQGGMGSVYEAEQDRPQRIVALKVIKPGFISEEALRRFDRESRLLGKLQHPGIAQIYEAGTADSGAGPRPFFAMEFIRGESLLEHVRGRRLGIRETLTLMAQVCDAVHHAHQKGVIHRDLKPGNIVVDGTGQPKVLDFGVARATDTVAQATMQTDVGELVGTLPYMSPEQVKADPSGLDTRSDVYALGVVLYEILAGRRPHELQRKALHEALRAICEDDPTPLSQVNRVFRGDVETIVGKALEKERDRRYHSAADLAADIRHFLANEPIRAHKPSATYQLGKFARRNRALVAGVAAAFVVLVAGIVATSWQAVRARREALKARTANEFLQDMLGAASPRSLTKEYPERGRGVTVLQVLGGAVRRLNAGTFKDQPLVEAALRRTIGATYRELGDYVGADSNLQRSLVLRRKYLGDQDPEVAESLDDLGLLALMRGKPAEAEPLLRRALEIRRNRLGSDHPLVAETLNDLAQILQDEGKSQEADSLFRLALALQGRPSDAPSEHARTLNSLALLAQERGDLAGADSLFDRALEIRRQALGADHPDVASTLHSLALLKKQEGRPAEAERLMREALDLWRRILGGKHPYVATTATNLGVLLREQGKLAEAEPLMREAAEVQRAALGDDDPQLGGTLYNLAKLLQAEGKPLEAEPVVREALAIERKTLPPDHPVVIAMTAGLGSILSDAGRPTEAEPLLRDALARLKSLSPGDWQVSQIQSLLGAALLAQGRYAEAEPLLLEGNDGLRAAAAASPDRKRMAVERLVRLYEKWTAARLDPRRSEQLTAWRDTLAAFTR